jgi:hypothetical protein
MQCVKFIFCKDDFNYINFEENVEEKDLEKYCETHDYSRYKILDFKKKNKGEKALTLIGSWLVLKEDNNKIPDCYALQNYVDGFGHDTATITIFKDLRQARDYYQKKGKNNPWTNKAVIVPVCFNEEYYEYFD